MKKMTSYIVAGVKADDEAVFMQRVGELLEKKGLLEFLTDGVPVGVRVVDEDELFKAFANRLNRKDSLMEILDVKIDENFSVQINYKYVYDSKFFKTMEEKDSWERDSYSFKGEKSEKLEGDFTIVGKRYSTSWNSVPNDIPGIEIWYV